MSNETKEAVKEVVKEVKKTGHELLNANIDDLSNEELERRTAIIKAKAEEANLQDIKDRLDDRQNKRLMIRERFESRGRELRKTERDREIVQKHCRHQKGGMGDKPGGMLDGDDPRHSLIKHVLPTNQMWIRCQRCGQTWKPVLRTDFVLGAKGDADYEEAKQQYAWALKANTDNKTSTSITFQWVGPKDGDGAAFVHETMKDVTLR